jgi:hypothetical protein
MGKRSKPLESPDNFYLKAAEGWGCNKMEPAVFKNCVSAIG